jgi:hypothetical protein
MKAKETIMTKQEWDEYASSAEGKAFIQPLIDKAVTSGITTYKKNHPGEKDLGTRLDAIEKASENRDHELARVKLDRFLFEACVKTGAPYALLVDELELMKDENDVTARIQKVSEYLSLKNKNELEQLIIENAHKPGSGVVGDRPVRLSDLSPVQAQFLEQMGQLDQIIRDQGS